MRKFRKINTQDENVQRLQDAISESFNDIERLPQLDSNIVRDIVMTSGVDNLVSHGLNRAVLGFQVIDINANTVVWKSSNANAQPNKLIYLRVNASCTASILFF